MKSQPRLHSEEFAANQVSEISLSNLRSEATLQSYNVVKKIYEQVQVKLGRYSYGELQSLLMNGLALSWVKPSRGYDMIARQMRQIMSSLKRVVPPRCNGMPQAMVNGRQSIRIV